MELIVISSEGIVIRTRMDSIRPMGRATQGVSVINVAPGDSVAALATIDMGGGTNGGPKAPEGKQPPLTGIDEAPAKGEKATGPARKPTPIRGRTSAAKPARPAPKKSSPARSARPASKPAAKTKPTASKGQSKPKRR
jgi:hypothetical protein